MFIYKEWKHSKNNIFHMQIKNNPSISKTYASLNAFFHMFKSQIKKQQPGNPHFFKTAQLISKSKALSFLKKKSLYFCLWLQN